MDLYVELIPGNQTTLLQSSTESEMDFYVEIVQGNRVDVLTSISYPPSGIEIGVPAVTRLDYAIIETGDPLPSDPAVQFVFEVAP